MSNSRSAALLSALAILLVSCNSQKPSEKTSQDEVSPPERSIGTPGGRMVVATWGGPKTLNPIVENESSSSAVTGLVFSGLTEVDAHTGLPKGNLAESWTVDSTGLVWTFRLRDSLRFNDGSPLTAEDVVFTWTKLLFDTTILSATRDLHKIDGKFPEVKALDPRSVEFRLPRRFAPFATAVGGVPVLSKTRLQNMTGARFNAAYGIKTPGDSLVGTGAYKLARIEPGQRIVMVRNPYYWKRDSAGQRLPYIDTVIQVIVQDQQAEILKFKAGELDAIDNQTFSPADFPVLKPLEKQGGFRIYKFGPNLNTTYIMFNQNLGRGRDGKPHVPPVKLAWFRDARFRRAVSFAIDRKAIIDIVWNGLGYPQSGPFSPSIGYFQNATLPPLPTNLDSARAELEAAGFRWRPDGTLEDAKGNAVAFTLLTNAENKARIDIAGMIRKDLEKLGIKATFTQIEFNALVERLDNTYQWDCVLLGLGGGSADPHFGANVWKSEGRTHMWFPRQSKPSTPWEAELDSLVEAGVQAIDTGERKRTYDRLQQIVRVEQPFIYIGHPESMAAVRNRFGNIDPTPLGGPFHNLDEIFIRRGK